ncbi:hypothetical protein EG328_004942 [Venturia inaequalis]|uniref:Uncharacterized protein n=1 Tax=Venturia inaequalis TaxID=5025 RepID=A0A8H3VNR7_VENIN|nr:hypothetical protein EG328_004942 [Venturia inaequalis]KAE9991221.1 hypothetical protein EG327_000276 [Venturia inaequalis]
MTLNNQSSGSSAAAPINLVTPDVSIIEIEDSIDESLPSLSALGWPKKPTTIAEQEDLFAALEKQIEQETTTAITEKPIEAILRPTFQPHPNLAEYLIPIVKKRWDEIPTKYLFPPLYVGERPPLFVQSFEEGLDYLHNYTFSQGFAIVIYNRPSNGSRVQVRCIHYGEPRNYHKLPNHKGEKIEVDGRIIERVQENTTIRKEGCKWAAQISYIQES